MLMECIVTFPVQWYYFYVEGGIGGHAPLDFFLFFQMEIVFTLTFYMLIECIVPFLVEWFCLYVGVGDQGA